MADPLSIAGSIAGIVTGGAQLSICLYNIASRLKSAPQEVADLAGEISFLSQTLSTIGDVLKQGKSLYTPCMLWELELRISRIEEIHREVRGLTKSGRGLHRFLWIIRTGRVKALMARVESHKSAMSLVLSTMQLALFQRSSK